MSNDTLSNEEMDRITTIKEIAEGLNKTMAHPSRQTDSLNKIIALCEKQEVKGKVITNPVEEWGNQQKEEWTKLLMPSNHMQNSRIAEKLQEILIRPKETPLFVYWTSGMLTVYASTKVNPDSFDHCIETTNAQIKEIGVMVEDWQELASAGVLEAVE